MMIARPRVADSVLATLAFLLALTAVVRWRTAVPPSAALAVAIGTPPAVASRPDPDELRDEASAVAARNPFRVGRVPSTVAYVPAIQRNATVVQAPPPAPKPALVLKGIVGGPPWMALMDGLPGEAPGALVRAGATFDKVTIRAITRDSVIVQFPDTTWVLTLAAPGGVRR
jgi:hypothetical protein